MAQSIRRRLKYGVGAALIKPLLGITALLPLPVSHAIGTVLGWSLAVIPNELRRITRINLKICFPELGDAERARMARRSLTESGKGLMETGAIWLRSRKRVLSLIREVHGEHHVSKALAQGNGVIMALTHLGAWEALGFYLGANYPITAMARPLRMGALDCLVRRARERSGAKLVATDKGGVRALYEALGRGDMVWIMADQEPSMGSGVFTPFFGVSAKTAVLLPRLVLRTRAPVIFACAERLPRGAGYRLRFVPAADIAVAGDLAATTQKLNLAAESLIRTRAAQYLWSYKRFRSRPRKDSNVY